MNLYWILMYVFLGISVIATLGCLIFLILIIIRRFL